MYAGNAHLQYMYIISGLETDHKQRECLRSVDMCKGYLSNIDFHSNPVEAAVQLLESQIVSGVTAGNILEPLIEDLAKKITRYNAGMKQVKTVYVAGRKIVMRRGLFQSWMLSAGCLCTGSQALSHLRRIHLPRRPMRRAGHGNLSTEPVMSV